jgi:hypothetical protein
MIAKLGDPTRRRSTKCPSRLTGQSRSYYGLPQKGANPAPRVKEMSAAIGGDLEGARPTRARTVLADALGRRPATFEWRIGPDRVSGSRFVRIVV